MLVHQLSELDSECLHLLRSLDVGHWWVFSSQVLFNFFYGKESFCLVEVLSESLLLMVVLV